MNEYQIALTIGAVITALISCRLPHALLWLAFGAVSALACYLVAAYGVRPPYAEAFNLCTDVLLCLAIQVGANEPWEVRLVRIYQVSILMSVVMLMLRLVGIIPVSIESVELYKTGLELCNWAAMITISRTAITTMAASSDLLFRSRWRPYVLRNLRALRTPLQTRHVFRQGLQKASKRW